jgi:hypothetical protein
MKTKPDPFDTNEEWFDTWKSLFSFLRHDGRLIIDASEEEVLPKETLSGVLLSDGTRKPEDISFEPGVIDRAAEDTGSIEDNPFTVFLIGDDDSTAKTIRQETGLLSLTFEEVEKKWSERFDSETVDVSPESAPFQWKDLRPHADPSNSIVVVDKYAFGQLTSRKSLESNLGALLLSLLPEDAPDWPVHITIVTDLESAVVEQDRSVNDLYDTLSDFMRKHRGDLEIYLTLLGLSLDSGHEDRYVFTNYGFFASGDSFDFFREDGSLRKDTLLQYIPFKEHENEVVRRLRRFADLAESPPTVVRAGGDTAFLAAGHQTNRLLDRVRDSAAES